MTTETTNENSAIVRRGYDALNSADLATLIELFDENASWHTPGRSPLAGDADGRDAVFAQFGRYADETGGTFTADLKRVLTDEDGRVIGIHHTLAERGDRRLDVYGCIVFELEDGRIVDGREHFYDLRTWDEFWS
jgi:ketosteroid isomerase-like protein